MMYTAMYLNIIQVLTYEIKVFYNLYKMICFKK